MTGTSTLVELLLARIEQDERIVDLSYRHPHARRYGRPPADRGRVAIHAGTLLSLSDSRTPSCRSGVKARPRAITDSDRSPQGAPVGQRRQVRW